jgi:hypothetical protein
MVGCLFWLNTFSLIWWQRTAFPAEESPRSPNLNRDIVISKLSADWFFPFRWTISLKNWIYKDIFNSIRVINEYWNFNASRNPSIWLTSDPTIPFKTFESGKVGTMQLSLKMWTNPLSWPFDEGWRIRIRIRNRVWISILSKHIHNSAGIDWLSFHLCAPFAFQLVATAMISLIAVWNSRISLSETPFSRLLNQDIVSEFVKNHSLLTWKMEELHDLLTIQWLFEIWGYLR